MTTQARVKVTKIEWDTDGKKVRGLPSEMTVEIDLNELISDEMSAVTDWCVGGYEIASVDLIPD